MQQIPDVCTSLKLPSQPVGLCNPPPLPVLSHSLPSLPSLQQSCILTSAKLSTCPGEESKIDLSPNAAKCIKPTHWEK